MKKYMQVCVCVNVCVSVWSDSIFTPMGVRWSIVCRKLKLDTIRVYQWGLGKLQEDDLIKQCKIIKKDELDLYEIKW